MGDHKQNGENYNALYFMSNRKERINLVGKTIAVSAGQTAGTCEPDASSSHSQKRYDILFLDTM